MLRPLACVAALLVIGCAKKPETKTAQDSLTRRQKDSAIGASQIPGAQGVRGAMNAADTVNSRTAAIDPAGSEIQ